MRHERLWLARDVGAAEPGGCGDEQAGLHRLVDTLTPALLSLRRRLKAVDFVAEHMPQQLPESMPRAAWKDSTTLLSTEGLPGPVITKWFETAGA